MNMNEDHGLVSLWVGAAESADALEKYLEFQYTEDGDAILPPFARDFDIEWFNEDLREAEKINTSSRSLKYLLSGFSYQDAIIPRFVDSCGDTLDIDANAVVLLYDFCYDGRIHAMSSDDIRLNYIGVVSYE